MGGAFKCDDCGELIEGDSEIVSPDSGVVKTGVVHVGLGDFIESADERLRIRFQIVRAAELEGDSTKDEEVELCDACQVAAMFRAALTLAWACHVPVQYDRKYKRLMVGQKAALHLRKPK